MPRMLTAAALFKETDSEVWKTAAAAYGKCLLRKKDPVILVKDDAYLNGALGEAIKKSKLTVDDLEQVMRWKLARGKWRPKLQALVATNTADGVLASCKAANVCLASNNIRGALKAYCTLKGIGAATASLLLSLSCNTCPFMSDEAYEAAVGSKIVRYSEKEYLAFQSLVSDKAEELSVSADYIEKALWAQHMTFSVASEDAQPQKKKQRVK